MRIRIRLLLSSLAIVSITSVGLIGEPTPEPAAAPEITSLVADLRAHLPNLSANGSWRDRITVTPSGTMILGTRGADGKGEIVQILETALDLSRERYVELALGVGAQNGVPEVTVAFSDADGTQYIARLRIDQVVPQQAIWLRTHLADFRLNDWDHKGAGRQIDWTRIKQWHLQGDWTTTAPCQAIFIALRTRR
jgi:hypothetical protein